MPRDGSNIYSKPAGTTAVTGTAVGSSAYNTFCDDLVTDANTARAIVVGGTGATTAAGARANLGVSATDPTITAIAALDFTTAGSMMYSTAADTFSLLTSTTAGRALLTGADASAQRTSLGLVIGTNVQAYDADLTTWSGLTPSAYFQTLVDDADAATARTTLGLGTAAVKATGTSGNTVPLLDGTNTWSGAQAFAMTGTPVAEFNRTTGSLYTFSLKDAGTVRGYVGSDSTYAFAVANSGLAQILGSNLSNGNLVVFGAITSGGVAVPTISSSDTLSNKTLSSPTLSGTVAGSPTFSGNPIFSGQIYSSSTDPYYHMLETDQGVGSKGWSQYASGGVFYHTLDNDSNSPTTVIYNISRSTTVSATWDFASTTAITKAGVAIPTISSTDTFTNKTLTSPTINGASLSGTLSGTPTFSGNVTFTGGNLILNAANYGIEIGSSASSNTPYIDFHTTNSVNDYDVRVIASGGTTLGTGLLNIIGGSFQFNSVEVPTISSTSTFTNKTLTSPTINGGTIQSRVQISSETTGSLTSASANKIVQCTGGVTMATATFTAGDMIVLDPGTAARTITRGASIAMYVNGTDSATATLAANQIGGAHWRSSTVCVLTGAVS